MKRCDDSESAISIIRDEITPSMIIEGACVLNGWLDRDPDLRSQAKNANDLACLVYAAMYRAKSQVRRRAPSNRS